MKRSNSGNAENMFEGANVGRIVSTFILRDALHGFVRVQYRIMWMFRCFRFSHSQQRKSGGGGRHNNLLILLTIYTWGICTRRAGKLYRARSRLYRRRFLQVNMRWKRAPLRYPKTDLGKKRITTISTASSRSNIHIGPAYGNSFGSRPSFT